ncbi:5'-3'-deoxyribonucleotidase [Marinilongibacter aquaticus]|uniref:5' nucleotidase, NT5C type n=1 Tax=Marinilongibacter aquaticus TaxID=2975157 RepID=UPI0021BDA3A2|nr:5'-3'-deoxyribonucleotidase [Marinilongibacter aquaticus]UBM58471.1 5'-3'-deoxyribonucleotidase [Marinilongibacter aquaticus]
MEKMRIAIDMDDVMADTSEAIVQIYNEAFGTLHSKNDFLTDLRWADHHENYQKVRHQLFEPGFFRNIPVMEGAQEVVKALHDRYELFVVSAAMEFPNSLKDKYDWLEEHFPYIHWKNIVFCGDKSIVRAHVIIDDHEKNLIDFEGRAMMFNAMHNLEIEGYERVMNWQEVGERLL